MKPKVLKCNFLPGFDLQKYGNPAALCNLCQHTDVGGFDIALILCKWTINILDVHSNKYNHIYFKNKVHTRGVEMENCKTKRQK